MAEAFGVGDGIVGVIGLTIQIAQVVVQFGMDWKHAPDNLYTFMTELATLKTVLSETNINIIMNKDFARAFPNQQSVLLSELGPDAPPETETKHKADDLDGKEQTLFCPGIPGAGKTILTSIVIEELDTRFLDDTHTGIAYIYCNFRRQHEQNLSNLLASLLKQLAMCQSPLPASVRELYHRHEKNGTQPSSTELSNTLEAVAAEYSNLFIIASDKHLQKFLFEIFSLQTKVGANIFATSRFTPEITNRFRGCPSLEIRAIEEDIQRYLSSHMSQLPAFVTSRSDLQRDIVNGISSAVDGMFLLAQLHLATLKRTRSVKAVRTSLKKLVSGSGESRYDDAYREITCTKRALTIVELQHALATEVGESEFDEKNISPIELIISACAGLVTVDEQSGIIRLVHYTAQKYFEQTHRQWFPDAEINIATICITYLSLNKCKNHYASQNWGHHAREASVLIPEVTRFLEREARVQASSEGLRSFKKGWNHKFPAREVTGLHLAAYFGLTPHAQILLEKESVAVPATDSNGSTPLYWAAYNGHANVAKLLLESGANVNASSWGGWTPLHGASENGHVNVVRLLLGHRANPFALNSLNYDAETPLRRASRYRHIEVCKLLLEQEVDINRPPKHGERLLDWASRYGDAELVDLLLKKGASVKVARNRGDGWTPLHIASQSNVDVVDLLLREGCDVNALTDSGRTPLMIASIYEKLDIVKLLIEKGAQMNIADDRGRTPLDVGLDNENTDVVEILQEKGAKYHSN